MFYLPPKPAMLISTNKENNNINKKRWGGQGETIFKVCLLQSLLHFRVGCVSAISQVLSFSCKCCGLVCLTSDVFGAFSLTYLYNFTEQFIADPADGMGIPRLVIVIGVVVIIIVIIVVVVTVYLVRKHRRRKASQVRKKPEDAQKDVSV